MSYDEEHASIILESSKKINFVTETMLSYYTVDKILRKIEEFYPDSYDEIFLGAKNDIEEHEKRIKRI